MIFPFRLLYLHFPLHLLLLQPQLTMEAQYVTSLPPTLAPSSRGLAPSVLAPIIIGSGIVGFLFGLIIFLFYIRWKTNRVPSEDPLTAEEQPQEQQREGTMILEELLVATNYFSQNNIIDEDGFGQVYRGVLADGRLIAVKKFSQSRREGKDEFRAEVDVCTGIQHPNLVRIVGYCVSGQERLLVYEFIPNGTLRHHLHGNGVPFMNWEKRMKVGIGTAKCLVYMHEECMPVIIHRDIKATNILLGEDFEPKVSNFGAAKCQLDTQTHVSTRVIGTYGYLDPAYVASGQVTKKADVFSFGIVLLELITGCRPFDDTKDYPECLLYIKVRPLLQEALDGHGLDPLVDHRLSGDGYNEEEMIRMVACAAACTRQSPFLRPEMSQVLRVLQASLPLSILSG